MKMIHASCVSFDGFGVLLRGKAGVGKSDLALRLIERKYAQLVGDDQICLEKQAMQVLASPAPKLEGLLHVTHLAIISRGFCTRVKLGLIIDLVEASQKQALALIATPETELLMGVRLRRLSLCGVEDSAIEKICCAVELIKQGGFECNGQILAQ